MSAILKHVITPPEYGDPDGGREVYLLKLKDKPTQRGVKISDGGREMRILEIRVVKLAKENNKIVIEIIKGKDDAAIIVKPKFSK